MPAQILSPAFAAFPLTLVTQASPSAAANITAAAAVNRTAAAGTTAGTNAAGPRPLRLTRRGRLVLIGFPMMLTAASALVVLGFFTAPAMASSGGEPELTRTVQVSVGTGESLWGLAADLVPDRDTRAVVADIMELNNLADATIPAGIKLYVPVSR